MNTILKYTNLESETWTPQASLDINPVLPKDLAVFNNGKDGALWYSTYADEAWGGGLIKLNVPYETVAGQPLPYFALDFDEYLSAYDLSAVGNLESDLKIVCGPALNVPNLADASCQLNVYQQKGVYQVDGPAVGTVPPTWENTSYIPASIVPDSWTHVGIRGVIDFTDKVSSVTAIGQHPVNGQETPPLPTQLVAPTPSRVPWLTTNWQLGICAVQLQVEPWCPALIRVGYKNIKVRFGLAPLT